MGATLPPFCSDRVPITRRSINGRAIRAATSKARIDRISLPPKTAVAVHTRSTFSRPALVYLHGIAAFTPYQEELPGSCLGQGGGFCEPLVASISHSRKTKLTRVILRRSIGVAGRERRGGPGV